ncbi:MAG: hypothetical protein WCT12_01415 [Verrucomicrobiota bacterium]|jgi:hypothetical protein
MSIPEESMKDRFSPVVVPCTGRVINAPGGPVIRKIQAAGKGVMVDLQLDELETFIVATRPEGLYLCIAAPESLQPEILKRLEKW